MEGYAANPWRMDDLITARNTGPRIVAIGGGTGLSTMLRGIKDCSENLTAIVTVSDDGGGSGLLRQDLGMLPPGDIRNCLLALSNTEPLLRQLLTYRFSEGSLSGQSFGNLFLAALNSISDSFDQAVSRMSQVLAITGRVLPVSNAPMDLLAEFENGERVLGESSITEHKKQNGSRIRRIRLSPEHVPALPDALDALHSADLILIGPGSLYTSIIPNLLVDSMAEAIAGSSALKVYICNVMTQEGETEGYTAYDHVRALEAHGGTGLFNLCLVNSAHVPQTLRDRYQAERASPLTVDRQLFAQAGIELLERPLIGSDTQFARHDSRRLATAIMELYVEKRPRSGPYGEGDRLILEYLRNLI